ncbi:hypothetical protein OV079_34205 [Nannocystis pusilla]|uniref:Uncharacterized protein n=1 Tax=Nannocystis pusilla TaxID=889268 RepID=A0A9X3EUI4_9BACT|nr:hypothetical protein [Nannocystis pusilla]MCY1010532.1 hypothetical protein [Nannocystis pusilla]
MLPRLDHRPVQELDHRLDAAVGVARQHLEREAAVVVGDLGVALDDRQQHAVAQELRGRQARRAVLQRQPGRAHRHRHHRHHVELVDRADDDEVDPQRQLDRRVAQRREVGQQRRRAPGDRRLGAHELDHHPGQAGPARAVEADRAQADEAAVDAGLEAAEVEVERRPQLGREGPLAGLAGPLEQGAEDRLGGRVIAGEEQALGAQQVERERGLRGVGGDRGQRGGAGGRVGGGRRERARGPGLARRRQIDVGQRPPLVGVLDAAGRGVEVVGDLEQLRVALVDRVAAAQAPGQREVDGRALARGQRRLDGLLHAVVEEPPAPAAGDDQARARRLDQRRGDLRLRAPGQVGQQRRVELAADAGGAAERLAGRLSQRTCPLDHDRNDIRGHRGAGDRGLVPGEAGALGVEGDQVVVGQVAQVLADEQRHAAGAVVDQRRQRGDLGRGAAEGVGEQRGGVVLGQRAQVDAARHLGQRSQGLLQQRRHGLVAERGDHQQAGRALAGQQRGEQLERGGVGPLQVVEQQHQRRGRVGEGADERAHGPVQAALGGPGRVAVGRAGAGAGQRGPQLGQEGEQRAGEAAERPLERERAAGQALLGVGEHGLDELHERGPQRAVGLVAAQLLELAGDEAAAAAGDLAVELVDQRGLADARRAGDQQQLGRAGADPRVGGRQLDGRRLAPVQPRRQFEPRRRVVARQREARRRLAGPHALAAALEVVAQAARALVAVICLFGQ